MPGPPSVPVSGASPDSQRLPVSAPAGEEGFANELLAWAADLGLRVGPVRNSCLTLVSLPGQNTVGGRHQPLGRRGLRSHPVASIRRTLVRLPVDQSASHTSVH